MNKRNFRTHVEKVFQRAIDEFTSCPEFRALESGNALSRGGETRSRENFADEFDRALAQQNCEYASRRASERLDAPTLWEMRDGWSDRVAGEEFRTGKREAQYKWRQLVLEWDPTSRAEVAGSSQPHLSLAS